MDIPSSSHTDQQCLLDDASPLFGGYNIAISDSITPIASQWDRFTDSEILMSSQYLRVLELAPLEDISYKYGTFTLDGKCVGIIYWQVKDFSLYRSLDIQPTSDNLFDRLFARVKRLGARLINDNLLVVGNVSITGEYGFRFSDSVTLKDRSRLVHESCQHFIKVSKSNKVKIKTTMIKDFMVDENKYTSKFEHKNYMGYSVDPAMIVQVNPEWKDFEGYLASMKSKARTRIKRAKKLGAELEVRLLSIEDLKESRERMYEMYESVVSYSAFNLFKLNKDYFITIKERMGDAVEIKGIYLEDKMIAYYSTIIDDNCTHGHFLGYDEEYNIKYQLYLNILLWLLEKAIACGCQELNLSRTALEIKSSIGALPQDYVVYTQAQNNLLNNAMKKVVPIFIPENKWTPRSPFKEMKS